MHVRCFRPETPDRPAESYTLRITSTAAVEIMPATDPPPANLHRFYPDSEEFVVHLKNILPPSEGWKYEVI